MGENITTTNPLILLRLVFLFLSFAKMLVPVKQPGGRGL
jgi:hypothetical protein